MIDTVLKVSKTSRIGQFEVGRISYGCWRFDSSTKEEGIAKLRAALDIGTNLIDTADIYGFGETGFGSVESKMGEIFSKEKGLREQIVLATKGGVYPPLPYNNSKKYLIEACENSLRRLNTEVIDIYYIHRPDLLTPHSEVAEALGVLKQSGKIREAGVSNYTVSQTRALQSLIDFPLAVIQSEISPLRVDVMTDGTLDLAQELNIRPVAWSPLAGGRLVSDASKDDSDRLLNLKSVLDRIAEENCCQRDAVILAWLMLHPSEIIPTIGSQRIERIITSAAAYNVKFKRQDWYSVLEVSLGHRMP